MLLYHLLGEHDGEFGRVGVPQGRQRRVHPGAVARGAGVRGGDPARGAGRDRCGRATAACAASRSRTARSSTRRSWSRRSTRAGRSPSSSTRGSCRPTSSTRSGGSGSRAPRRRSTSRSTGCRSYPALAGRDDHFRGFTNIGPSMEYLERAFDEAKYGWYSSPAVPRLRDPEHDRPRHGAARQARDVVLRPVRAVPPRESDWDTERQNLGDTVQRTLESFFPGFGDLILHREVVTPIDIERGPGPVRGQHLRRRVPRAADVLVPARAGLRATTGRRSRATTSAAPARTRAAA